MKKLVWLLAGISSLLILAACTNNRNGSSLTNHPLEGTNWKLTSLTSLPGGLPKTPKEITLRMDTGRVMGSGGCNRYFGSYSLNGTGLKFNGVASTKMFCQGAMEAEDGLMQSMNNTDGYFIRGRWMWLLKGVDTLAKFESTRMMGK